MKKLWILTEERPKNNVIELIIELLCRDFGMEFSLGRVRIVPILKNKRFTFIYRVEGLSIKGIDDIFIKIVSGDSSFVDYLIFLQENEPNEKSKPLYLIEETKTDDSESRNTGIYQRCSKFVFANFFYPNAKKIMLYNLQIQEKEKPSATNIFGTKLLRTLRVDIIGKLNFSPKPFTSVDEIIEAKNTMRDPPINNVPIKIYKFKDRITISGRLYKNGSLAHDPNIGALSLISSCLRQLGWNKKIIILSHGLSQSNIGKDNKFIKICNQLDIEIDGLSLPKISNKGAYWHYEKKKEKLVSIFLHVVVENFSKGKGIYENHGGCERGYFINSNGDKVAIPKYQEGQRDNYKNGDKSLIISLPDTILYDADRNEIVDLEGKKYEKRKDGIKELENYGYLDERYIKPSYRPSFINRTVAVFGGKKEKIEEEEVSFMLNEEGELVLGKNPPSLIKEAIEKLLSSQ